MQIQSDISKRTLTFVLAGGRGERLAPLTEDCPKPAVSFGASSRIIDFTLANCIRSKLPQAYLLTQYKHQRLHSYVQTVWRRRGCEIECLPPPSGKKYRGTADAVAQNIALVRSVKPEFVLILSGDHIYRMDYTALLLQHVISGAELTISATECSIDVARQFGVLRTQGTRVVGFDEKPGRPAPLPDAPERALVNMGVYVFNAETLAGIETGSTFNSDFGQHVLPELIGSKHVESFNVLHNDCMLSNYWRDVGTLDSYYEANMDILSFGFPGIALTARIGNSSVSRSVVARGVEIAPHASVVNSILLPGARIEKGAFVRNAIVGENTTVAAQSHIGYDLRQDRERFQVTEKGVAVIAEPVQKTSSLDGRQAHYLNYMGA